MATLQKFKFLATQCTIINSPTRSPNSSPVIHLRRRKTFRMLLGRSTSALHRRRPPPSPNAQISSRLKVKDLFVISSTPPLPESPMKLLSDGALISVPSHHCETILSLSTFSPSSATF